MTFSEKLGFLMNMTETTNSALAHAIALDASYISRLRAGKRLRPKNTGVIRDMAAWFARHSTQEYQQKAVADALAIPPDDVAALSEHIERWLLQDGEAGTQRVGLFLGSLSGVQGMAAPVRLQETGGIPFPRDSVLIRYGIEGKRQAVAFFLEEVASRAKPQTLLLYSDEETTWMTGDPAFAQRWAALMLRVLALGNRIIIIHTISRDLDEMLSAISQWMPLYMSGLIMPYFYPKKRDGVFKRTLFIAPKTAAVVSSSVGDMVAGAANILCRDRAAVAAFREEFMQYLRLCRPLMRIFTLQDREASLETLAEFEQEHADTILKTESLSLLTMPQPLLAQIARRTENADGSILELHRKRICSFLETLKTNRVTEIITLPDVETLKKGGVKVGMSVLMGGGTVCYTPAEYAAHLAHLVELLAAHAGFHVHILKGKTEDRYMVYAREELGVVVAKTSQPPVMLAINEGNMTAAFWDFLRNSIGERAYENPDNEAVIRCLREYLQTLTESC